MSFSKNQIELRGYVNYLKQQPLSAGGFLFKFSITLAAGKDIAGNYKKEYMNVTVAKDCSASNAGKFADGDFVQIEGRLRNEKYQANDGTTKTFTYVEAFDLFCLVKGQGGYQQQQPQGQPQQYQQPQQPQQPQAPQYYQPQGAQVASQQQPQEAPNAAPQPAPAVAAQSQQPTVNQGDYVGQSYPNQQIDLPNY